MCRHTYDHAHKQVFRRKYIDMCMDVCIDTNMDTSVDMRAGPKSDYGHKKMTNLKKKAYCYV